MFLSTLIPQSYPLYGALLPTQGELSDALDYMCAKKSEDYITQESSGNIAQALIDRITAGEAFVGTVTGWRVYRGHRRPTAVLVPGVSPLTHGKVNDRELVTGATPDEVDGEVRRRVHASTLMLITARRARVIRETAVPAAVHSPVTTLAMTGK